MGVVKLYGTCSTLGKIKLFNFNYDAIIEGPMAHDYKDQMVRHEIKQSYNIRYRAAATPLTHPENYDPLNPPRGWAYDPYYEIWIKLNE